MSVLTRHWELKLLALAFSVALWVFVNTSEKSDMVVAVPIEVDGLSPGLAVAGDVPDSVDVQLHGLRGALARVIPERLRARLNAAGAGAGEVTFRVLPEDISVPPGITVLRINPSRIRLVLGPAAPRGRDSKGAPRS